ncbi:MAG: 3-dehydroquinate synthase [Trueperaceae bacterium]
MSSRRTVEVRVTPPYPVVVGAGVLGDLGALVTERDVALISDDNVAPLYQEGLEQALTSAGKRVSVFTVPAGEGSKNVATWHDLLRGLASMGLARDGAVVALGGGVVGDLAGFVAASYLRGVAFYQVPTSLLAMVDASVGGKTGLDLPEGKNLVGAFWQPKAVVADVRLLATLPEREFRHGTVELVKHGFLADPVLLDRFAAGWRQTMPEDGLADAVARSVAVKAEVVAADERESGRRAHLNLGHTLAHALEAVTNHVMPHGEAVAYGLVYAALLARARGMADLVPRTTALLRWVQPSPLPDVAFDALAPYLARDKKVAGGRLRFVLLEDVGRPLIIDDVTAEEQATAWRALREGTR